jgi:hypothetical protein
VGNVGILSGILSPLTGLAPNNVITMDASVDSDVIKDALRTERVYAFIGMLVGALVIVAGIVMIFLNISGQIDVTVHGSKLNTAVVGIPMAVVGAWIIYFTRLRVKVTKTADK